MSDLKIYLDKDIDTEYKHITNNQLIVYSEGLKDKLTWVD